MDVIIEANKDSVILTSLQKALRTDVSYRLTKNYPNLSKQMIKLQANPSGAISTPHGKEILFTLPRYGILSNLMLESSLTATATNTTMIVTGSAGGYSVDVGLSVFSDIELRSSNRVICSNSDVYLKCRVDSSALSKGLVHKHRARVFDSTDGTLLAATWAASAITTYTPVFCSFFEDVKNYLDLNFVEQLQLRCVYNTEAKMGLTEALTSATSYLHMWYYNLEASALAELRAKNFSPERPLVLLSYDTYVETGTCAASETTTIDLKCNNAVFATHIYFKNNAADGEQQPFRIKNVSVKLGGKTHFDTVPSHVMNYEADLAGGAGLVALNGQDASANFGSIVSGFYGRPVTIWWGLEPNERRFNSGAVSLHNVNNPQVVVTTSANASTSIDYYIVHEFWTTLAINPADGRVSVSASL